VYINITRNKSKGKSGHGSFRSQISVGGVAPRQNHDNIIGLAHEYLRYLISQSSNPSLIRWTEHNCVQMWRI